MPYNPDKHHRRSIRLKGYDYAAEGLYFITLCTAQRQCLFGVIVNGQMQLNSLGQIVAHEWMKTPQIRPNFDLDAWVVMPNHIHGIVVIHSSHPPNDEITPVGAHRRAPRGLATHGDDPLPNAKSGIAYRRPHSVSSFVAGFKAVTTKQINIQRNTAGTPIWQRNYYEHIIRSEDSLHYIQQYIYNNPVTWRDDQLHPANPSKI